MTISSRRAVGVALLSAVALSVGALSSQAVARPGPATQPAAPKGTTTSKAQAALVDRVQVKLDWFDCSALADGADCATAKLPLDYGKPSGAKTDVAVLRIKAKDQAHKIGTLFVNPGGPGASGTQIAASAPFFLGKAVLAKFDVVGFDPRGTNFSDNVKCWKDFQSQDKDIRALESTSFPYGKKQTDAYVASAKAFGKACSTTGKPLSASMSTAEVARDMDVLRRAVGDKQLTYLGFSYGTYLGQMYANLFPDRIRALVIDGNLDPVGWAGTQDSKNVPQSARIKSGEGADKALAELLARCAKTGPKYCSFASYGDPAKNYAEIVASIKKAPIVQKFPDGSTFTIDYPTLIGQLLSDLYAPVAGDFVDGDLSFVWQLLHPTSPAAKAAAVKDFGAKLQALKAKKAADDAFRRKQFGQSLANWPYNNSPEAFQSVLCTDGLNPADAAKWPQYVATASKTSPNFAQLWTWASAPCASNTWTVRDTNAYPGPFTADTSATVLVVGSYWDPATNYASSQKVSKLLPNSRLLSSDNWGHTAYGTSQCANDAIDAYLVSETVPKAGTVCKGADQPYTNPLPTDQSPTARGLKSVQGRHLPPVSSGLPGVLPLR
jgi:pimeloyl-ACP methyl ester carboxylesterase